MYNIVEYFKNNIYNSPIFFFLLGCFSALSFSSNSVFICIPIIFIALSCFFHLLYNNTNNLYYIFFISSLFSFGQLFTGLYWIANAFEFVYTYGIYFGLIAVILLTLVLSIFYGISCIILVYIKNIWRLNLFGFALIFSIFLSLGEYLRGNLLTGFPWNIVGYVWIDSSVVLQSVSLIGIYGLGLFTFLAATSLALVFKNINYAFYSLLPIFILLVYGAIRLYNVEDSSNKVVKVRVIQPNINQNEKWNSQLKSRHLDKLISLSIRDNGTKIPDIIIWPESSLPYSSSILEKNLEMINWLLENQVLITGITRTKYNKNDLSKIYNSALITDQNFQNPKYYDKVKLVPFGEYNPFKKILKFEKLTDGTLDFSSGKKTNSFKLEKINYNIAILICYEIIFSSKVINGFRPDFIVNITNDAWYGNTIGPLQHLAAARVRAIEEGLPVLRAANTGISAVIDQYGKYIQRLELGKEGVIDTNISLSNLKTIFSKYGNYIYLISLIFMLMLVKFPFISKNSTNWSK